MKKTIQVDVSDGMFSSERTASFEANGRRYVLVVDASRLHGNRMEVVVVEEREGEALVDLPADTFGAGSRVRLPADLLA